MIARSKIDYRKKCFRRLGNRHRGRPWLWGRQPKSNRRVRALLKQWGFTEVEA